MYSKKIYNDKRMKCFHIYLINHSLIYALIDKIIWHGNPINQDLNNIVTLVFLVSMYFVMNPILLKNHK